jgi:hypothetical protein
MKHLLNNISEEEKNRIREQHTGGKKIVIENFNKLLNSKLGDAKPLISEQKTEDPTKDMYSVLIGYLVKLSEDGGKKGIQGLDDMAAIKETRMYFEALRDGKTPKPLSKPAEIVKNYAMAETRKMQGQELVALKQYGENVKTKL